MMLVLIGEAVLAWLAFSFVSLPVCAILEGCVREAAPRTKGGGVVEKTLPYNVPVKEKPQTKAVAPAFRPITLHATGN